MDLDNEDTIVPFTLSHCVHDEDIRAYAFMLLERFWKEYGSDAAWSDRNLYFANPTSIARGNWPDLTSSLSYHLISLKTNGLRACIILTMTPQNDPIAILMNRACDLQLCDSVQNMHPSAHYGTILDVELDCSTRSMVVLDLIALGGDNRLQRLSFAARLEFVSKFLFSSGARNVTNVLTTNEANPPMITIANQSWCLKMKPWFSPSEFARMVPPQTLVKILQRHDDPADGLILAHGGSPLQFGHTHRIYKWKPKSHCTVDVRIERSGISWRIFASDTSINAMDLNETRQVILNLKQTGRVSLQVAELDCFFESAREIPSCIIECNIVKTDLGTAYIRPLLLRTDKSTPNSSSTIRKTIESFENGIELQELYTSFAMTCI